MSAGRLLHVLGGNCWQTPTGVNYVSNSRSRLPRLPRWIRVAVSYGGPLPTQLAAGPVSPIRPAYEVACPCAFYSRRIRRGPDGGGRAVAT